MAGGAGGWSEWSEPLLAVEVVAEEGKRGWRWARKCVPGVRCQAMECKVLVGLLRADCMSEWAIRAGGGVLVCRLAGGLLLLLEKVTLPVELLPLCIHVG